MRLERARAVTVGLVLIGSIVAGVGLIAVLIVQALT